MNKLSHIHLTGVLQKQCAFYFAQKEVSKIKQDQHYTQIPNAIFRSKILTTHDKAIYMALFSFCFNDKKVCFPTQETLSEYGSCSVAQVKKVLNRLEQYGLIKIINKGCKKVNNYEIVDIYSKHYMKDFKTHIDNHIGNRKVSAYAKSSDTVPHIEDAGNHIENEEVVSHVEVDDLPPSYYEAEEW